MDLKRIFEIPGLKELRDYLQKEAETEELREQLYAQFLQYSQYHNATEWNTAVRLCEALTIVGWGTHEPLEAIKGRWFNGNPETYFINRHAQTRFFDAVWSKRKEGFAIDYSLSFYHGTSVSPLTEAIRLNGGIGDIQDIALCSQRNWIAKNPICIVRGLANCYKSSRPVIESIENKLKPALRQRMRPELYGSAVNTILLDLSFSFYDNYCCKTNYIIADESLKLKQKDFYPELLEMYSEKEIKDNGYYLRNRFTYGPFRKDTGTARVHIVLKKEFSEQTSKEQKSVLSEYLLQAVERTAKRLERRISYNFPQMISDFKSILDDWNKKCD